MQRELFSDKIRELGHLLNTESYRSGRNEPHSKCGCPFRARGFESHTLRQKLTPPRSFLPGGFFLSFLFLSILSVIPFYLFLFIYSYLFYFFLSPGKNTPAVPYIRSNTGIYSMGASTVTSVPPSKVSPVEVSRHVPAGRYTWRRNWLRWKIGATRYFSPNIY